MCCRSELQRGASGGEGARRQPELELWGRRSGGGQQLHWEEAGGRDALTTLQEQHVLLLAAAAAAGAEELLSCDTIFINVDSSVDCFCL